MTADYCFYIGKIKFYDEYEEKESVDYCILAADSYTDAMRQVCNDWGEDNLISVELTPVGEGNGSICISESMARVFINDLPEEVYCIESDWRRKHDS